MAEAMRYLDRPTQRPAAVSSKLWPTLAKTAPVPTSLVQMVYNGTLITPPGAQWREVEPQTRVDREQRSAALSRRIVSRPVSRPQLLRAIQRKGACVST